MGLVYRPMVCDMEGNVAAYEAVVWFGGIADRPGDRDTAAELEPMLARAKMVGDISFYFLYEAADAVLRMNNCKLGLQGILVQMMPSFYSLNSQLERFNQLFAHQPIPREQLMLTIPEDVIKNADQERLEVIGQYINEGICLVLDGYHPESFTFQQLEQMGFKHVRFAPELHMMPETATAVRAMRQMGITVIGGGVEDHDTQGWMLACGVSFMSGTLCGVPVTEDEMIRDCLMREK